MAFPMNYIKNPLLEKAKKDERIDNFLAISRIWLFEHSP